LLDLEARQSHGAEQTYQTSFQCSSRRRSTSTVLLFPTIHTTQEHRSKGLEMAENVPPGSASKPAAAATDGRGIPYYEKLRRDLRDTLQRKRALDKSMVLAVFDSETWIFQTDFLRRTLKSKYTVTRPPTSKKPPLQATSSKDSTTTSNHLPAP
jgi:hypothetical protein